MITRTRDLPTTMRVGIYNDTPLEAHGGGEETELQVAAALRDRGHAVQLVTNCEKRDFPRVDSSSRASRRNGIPYSAIQFVRPNAFARLARWIQAVPPVSSLEQNDVSIIFLYRLPSSEYLLELAGLGKPVILALHGLAIRSVPSPSLAVRALQHHIQRSITALTRRGAPENVFFIVTTRALYQSLSRSRALQSRSFIIPSGIDFSSYSAGRNDHRFQVIFAARLVRRQKGLDRLVDVVRHPLLQDVPSLSWRVLGSGPDSNLLGRKLAHTPQVTLSGFVSSEDKVRALAESNLMIVTSSFEPYSLTAIEGLASGLPVVSTPTVGPISTVGSNKNFGTICEFSPTSMAQAILAYHAHWMSNREAYYQEKLDRRSQARILFDMRKMTDDYIEAVGAAAILARQ